MLIINFCDANKLKRIEYYLLAAMEKICAKVALLLNAFGHLITIFIRASKQTERTSKN